MSLKTKKRVDIFIIYIIVGAFQPIAIPYEIETDLNRKYYCWVIGSNNHNQSWLYVDLLFMLGPLFYVFTLPRTDTIVTFNNRIF